MIHCGVYNICKSKIYDSDGKNQEKKKYNYTDLRLYMNSMILLEGKL